MSTKAVTRLIAAAIMLLGAGTPLAAQTGVLSGRVFDAENGAPLSGASVQVLRAGDQITGGSTDDNGEFRFDVAPGTYSVVVSILGYGDRRIDGVRVGEGEEAVSVALASQAVQLNPIVVSASRGEEKALEAPADVVVVDAEQIADRPAPTVIEHVKALPGVDVSQTGLQQANVVTRGFNNVFSGAMLVITDNRYANVPSLRVNVYSFIPLTNHDLERIEMVLGPGAALYGPNSANGVMHMLTSSPITTPGTIVSVAAGERDVAHVEFRHAHSGGDKWGIRVSGQYFRGNDWRFTDDVEAAARAAAIVTDPDTRIGLRDFDAERYSTDLRVDVRPWEDGEVIFAGGLSKALSQIEMTGIGAAQALDWRYTYGQVRARKGRLFAQGFANFSESGDTYLLRTGQEVTDESYLLAGQVQHGFLLADRFDFIYGIDLQRTQPRTEGTITGRNEDDDTIDEIGGYVHGQVEVTDKLDLFGAIRVDDHSELEDPVFSPRAALVFEPIPEQNFRATFNRAFSTPTTNNLFLDIIAADQPFLALGIPGFSIRTLGTPESGLTFSRNCPGGFDGGLCMFTPATGAQPLPANAALAYNTILTAIAAINPAIQPLLPALQSPNPTVGTVLRRFNPETAGTDPFPLDPGGPEDIPRLEPTITNTFEVGYKGLLNNRVLISADVYRSDIEDFIGPLRVETPTVFMEPQSLGAFIVQQLTGAGIPLAQAQAVAAQLAPVMASIPIGTVAFDQNPSDEIVLAYRNFGSFDLWGVDAAVEILATDELTVGGSFSHVNTDCFDSNEDGDCDDVVDIALNAPKNKGSLMARWDDDASGLSFGGRARFVSDFPMNSGVYVGDIESYTVIDANVGYRLPWIAGSSITLQVYNVFDEEHQEFIGAPEIGRLALLRFMYSMQ